MIRVQFSLRTVFVVMTACALLLAWWVPPETEVRFANISFTQWRPSSPNLRITTEQQFYQLLGPNPGRSLLQGLPDWPDFAKSDVIQVPANGLAGETTAEYRVAALGKSVDVDFKNTPLKEVGEVLKKQYGTEVDYCPPSFDEDGVEPGMPITFKARGIALRDALHSMLEPRGLTFIVGAEGLFILVITDSVAKKAYPANILLTGDWLDHPPDLRHRLRFHGKLALITSFAGTVPLDSRAVGYTVPKGAKVLFVTERVANAIDFGYNLTVLLTAAVLIVRPGWCHGRPASIVTAG